MGPAIPFYGLLLLLGVVVSFIIWIRLARRDPKLLFLYITALAGAFLGAKLAYLLAEGWQYFYSPDSLVILLTGKSITGALLGGYVGVELGKKILGYKRATGDFFAIVAPLGIMLGRLGCLIQGCCRGRSDSWLCQTLGCSPIYSAASLEFIFNFFAFVCAVLLQKFNVLPNQHFNLYMIFYGVFRFFHEYSRQTPVLFGPFTGYQLIAIIIFLVGLLGYLFRRRQIIVSS